MSHPEIKLSAYARSIGLEIDNWEDGLPVLGIQYSRTICGNPGMFHGGAISTVLEAAAVAALDANLRAGHGPAILTPLNSTIQFLRAAGEERAFASAQICHRSSVAGKSRQTGGDSRSERSDNPHAKHVNGSRGATDKKPPAPLTETGEK
jgi:uncharacterized protein (TIGR00369 family)